MKKRNLLVVAGVTGAIVIGSIGGAVAAGVWGDPSSDHSNIRYNVSVGASGGVGEGTSKGAPLVLDLGDDFLITDDHQSFDVQVTAEDTDLTSLGIRISDGDPNRIVKQTVSPGVEKLFPDIFSQMRVKVTNTDTGAVLIDGEKVGRLSNDPNSPDYLKTAEPGVLEGSANGKIIEGQSQTLNIELWLDADFAGQDSLSVYNATTSKLNVQLEGVS